MSKLRLDTTISVGGYAAARAAKPSPDEEIISAALARTGATMMGRRMFSGGSGLWENDPNANGWWGEQPPFQSEVFVLTHHEREPLTLGDITFYLVTTASRARSSRPAPRPAQRTSRWGAARASLSST